MPQSSVVVLQRLGAMFLRAYAMLALGLGVVMLYAASSVGEPSTAVAVLMSALASLLLSGEIAPSMPAKLQGAERLMGAEFMSLMAFEGVVRMEVVASEDPRSPLSNVTLAMADGNFITSVYESDELDPSLAVDTRTNRVSGVLTLTQGELARVKALVMRTLSERVSMAATRSA